MIMSFKFFKRFEHMLVARARLRTVHLSSYFGTIFFRDIASTLLLRRPKLGPRRTSFSSPTTPSGPPCYPTSLPP